MRHPLSIIAACALLCSCGAKSIKTDRDKVYIPRPASDDTITVHADGAWSVAEKPQWITIGEKGDTTLAIHATENKTRRVRTDSIVLKGGSGVRHTVILNQSPHATYMDVKEKIAQFPVQGGTVKIRVNTDGWPVHLSCPEYIYYKQYNKEGWISVLLTTVTNRDEDRDFDITLSVDSFKHVIRYKQKGKPRLKQWSPAPVPASTNQAPLPEPAKGQDALPEVKANAEKEKNLPAAVKESNAGHIKCRQCNGKGIIDMYGEMEVVCDVCRGKGHY